MKSKLDNYQEVITDDGSVTLFSKIYGEACHSTSGAVLETKLHYIQGCQIQQKALEKNITILEVGFGVGIGFLETVKALKSFPFTFISTEIDENLILYMVEQNKILQGIERKTTPFLHYYLANENFTLMILVGNARETLVSFAKHFSLLFDCIYQDAFSPKRNAILWTQEWFELLYSLSGADCIMSTYSSSSSIRKSMLAAGWKLTKGDKFGPKRSSTRAVLKGESDPDILEHLARSPAITLTDANYETYHLGNHHEKK
jgi:tRNA U34 5-methylaminomethyl-2-thiouridine-forming methyltransferase MnmC